MFLKVSQYSQGNACVGVSFFNKDAGLKACNFFRKETRHTHFPMNIANFSRVAIFVEHLGEIYLSLF